ncbi:MAG: hypothetical protein JSW40_05850, partial [Candidatus Omnitrophota bacterium]
EQLSSLNENLQKHIARISGELEEKEKQISRLQEDLEGQVSSLGTKERSALRKTQELSSLNEVLRRQIAQLSDELSKKEESLNRLQENLRKQAFSLGGREATLRRTENLEALNEALKIQITTLSDEAVENKKKIAELQDDLRGARASSFSTRDVNALRKKISVRDKELEKINKSYARLKKQLKQVGKAVSEREIAVDQKDETINQLKKEIIQLQSNLDYWKGVSREITTNQEKILDELSRALDINASLQRRLKEVSAFLGKQRTERSASVGIEGIGDEEGFLPFEEEPEVKSKVEELRRKVEVILQGVESVGE